MTSEEIYPLARQLIEAGGRPITARALAENIYGTRVSVQTCMQLGLVLTHLCTEGKLERFGKYGTMYYQLPGTRAAREAVKHPAMPFITVQEMKKARERCQVGDVFPAEVYAPSETVDTMQRVTKDVVVDYKSQWLIHCTDGSTFSYAALAMYYRCGRPLGRWDR